MSFLRSSSKLFRVSQPTVKTGLPCAQSNLAAVRCYSSADSRGTRDKSSDAHTSNKKQYEDVQSDASHKAHQEKADDTAGGSAATTQKDSSNSTEKTKQEFKEAPDVIGMQDERGGKGR